MEQSKSGKVIFYFDQTLEMCAEFSGVQYYEAICLEELERNKASNLFFEQNHENEKNGYTINTDNVLIERNSYQNRGGFI